MAGGAAAGPAGGRRLAKARARLHAPLASLKVSGKVGAFAEGGAELGFKAAEKKQVARLRGAFNAFDRSRKRGLLLIDEAQVLADKRHHALEKALRAVLDTRRDRLEGIVTW